MSTRTNDEGLLRTDIDIDVASWGYMSMVFTMQYSQMLDLRDKFNDTILAEMNSTLATSFTGVNCCLYDSCAVRLRAGINRYCYWALYIS